MEMAFVALAAQRLATLVAAILACPQVALGMKLHARMNKRGPAKLDKIL
jgi:hypothetical protein